jgi:eukaryotic-like serine/threonine-protein kinase
MTTFSAAVRELLAAPSDQRRIGPYRCSELLDSAGTAPVFKAVEEHAGHAIREVAVKVFDVGRGGDKWRARVVGEARTLSRIQHPNVIRFHTLATDAQRGLLGLVMELAEGVSLDRELLSDGDRTAMAVKVGIAIASALCAAHEAGVVHCNVKPSNVVLTDGAYKLINFGIAASLQDDDDAKTRPRTLARGGLTADAIGRKAAELDPSPPAIPGAIGYVDPVCVATTAPPTAASDLYSLGAMLYECLAGHAPCVSGAAIDTDVLTGAARPKPVSEAAPSAPPELAKIVDALVSPAREDRPPSTDAVRRELERLRSTLAGRSRALPPEERGPFPGLDRYEPSDRDVFFGRSAEIAGALELCRTRSLVGIVGMSGCGKSSLARAGVVPAIEDGALGGWPAKYRSVLATPGRDLMGALRAALSGLLGSPLADDPDEIVEQLSAEVDETSEGIVLLVDQLEEIVVKKGDARRGLELLSRLADAPAGIRVIIVVRRDLLDEVLAVDAHFSRALSRGMQLLAPLHQAGWEEVLDASLEAYGYRFASSDVRAEVLDDVKNTAMPLAQFGLTRLWGRRDSKTKTIPREAFDAKEGMRGALEGHADRALADVKIPREKKEEVLLAMTTPEGTRAHVSLEDLESRFGAPAKEVVLALAKARIVASEKDGFTFVHDAVLREWPLLRRLVEDAREDRLLLAHVERDAGRWAASKDPAELWRKGRLAAAIDLWKQGSPLSSDARAFLRKSANEAAKVRVAFGFLVSLVLLLVVGGSLIYAKESRERAQQARHDAEALAAALTQVQILKHEAEENALEAAASAKLLEELKARMTAQVQTALSKVTSATSLDGARKAGEDLKAQSVGQAQVVPLDLRALSAGGSPKLDTSGPSPGAGEPTFDQGAIERVVNTRKAGVKRTCLERSASRASSTKVTAALTIAPNGTVQDVTTTGDDPAVAKCIEQQLRGWSFPPPGETKQVQIPFVFVRQ